MQARYAIWRVTLAFWILLPKPPLSDKGLKEWDYSAESVIAQKDAGIIISSLNAIRERQEARISALPPQAEGQIDLKDVFYRFILWPFAFAFALALRLTKVTADVTDWAKR